MGHDASHPRAHEGRRLSPWAALERPLKATKLSSAASNNRLSGKTAPKKIVTLVDRDQAAPRSFHITHVNFSIVRSAVVTNGDRSSHLRTDDVRFYNTIGRKFASRQATLHSDRGFSRGDGNHSNNAEDFFSILKRCRHRPSVVVAAHSPLSRRVRFPLLDKERHGYGAHRTGPRGHHRQAPYLSADCCARRLTTLSLHPGGAKSGSAGL